MSPGMMAVCKLVRDALDSRMKGLLEIGVWKAVICHQHPWVRSTICCGV
jgi:hypothetical protein